MKKRTLLLPLVGLFVYVTMSSNETGLAKNNFQHRTAGPGSSGNTCGDVGCHDETGAGTVTGSVEIRKKSTGASGPTVSHYMWDSTYIVTVKGTASSGATLKKFGFQIYNTKGTYSNLGSKVQKSTLGGSDFVMEHSSPIDAVSTGKYEISFDWTAPSASSGTSDITFYGILNGVDGDGSEHGDKSAPQFQTTLQHTLSVDDVATIRIFKAYPNPVVNDINIEMTESQPGNYNLTVYNVAGVQIETQEFYVSSVNNHTVVDASSWKRGMYFVRISKADQTQVLPVMKL